MQLSQGLRPSGEGQGGSEVAFVSGITLHMPQGLPTQVSLPSNSHPAPRTLGANASIPSCRTSRSQRGEEASTTSLPLGSTDDFGLQEDIELPLSAKTSLPLICMRKQDLENHWSRQWMATELCRRARSGCRSFAGHCDHCYEEA